MGSPRRTLTRSSPWPRPRSAEALLRDEFGSVTGEVVWKGTRASGKACVGVEAAGDAAAAAGPGAAEPGESEAQSRRRAG